MKLGRIFANAIARRIAYAIVALALAWLGLGDARAQTCPAATGGPDVNENHVDEPAAYFACNNWGATQNGLNSAGYIRNFIGCVKQGGSTPASAGSWRARFVIVKRNSDCSNTNAGLETTRSYFNFPGGSSCASRPPVTTLTAPAGSTGVGMQTGSFYCQNGCVAVATQNGDDTWTRSYASNTVCTPQDTPDLCEQLDYIYVAGLWCQPPADECDASQVRNASTGACENACPSGMTADGTGVCKPETDTCPAGQVRSPTGQCLPGDGQCAAGEARRPNGTCGRDSDGDGEADEDDDDEENDPDRETASGGDSCSAPPSCSGGAIDCMQVKIQWRIDCNTRSKVNVTGGACNAMPVCVGENCKAMEYAQLLQQWKAACALEKLNLSGDGVGGPGDNSDLIELLTGPGEIVGDYGGTGDMPGGGSYDWGSDGDEHEPDTGGFGYGSSCPSPPSFTVGGRTISIDLSIMCDWMALGGSIVLILAALASVRIISGGTA